ncbi:hypothetical protein [Hydrogenophaga sp. PAMC20947]|uniref:hypothetical protein n=1 Tax=Hydrogenophaga sp. PAMC20947 TaxID=2565558 RepID=UPI00109DC4F4|nr:hypothetical protein [Hydrogenophaga sp. PAMC20947]QCB47453.1 hypothetical protein E5678_16350 [Hydrogenophaga sp. PAMC20947]
MKPADPAAATASSSPGKNDKSAQEHLYRLNPKPQQAYEVVLTIEGAPGPFKIANWSAGYQAKGCTYIVNDWAGVRGVPEYRVELPFTHQPDGSYVATVYLDAMLDEDYYGNGLCEWTLTGVGAGGSPTGAPDEATFGGHIDLKGLESEAPHATFYPRAWYGKPAPETTNEHSKVSSALLGWMDRSTLPPELQNDLFSFVLKARRL